MEKNSFGKKSLEDQLSRLHKSFFKKEAPFTIGDYSVKYNTERNRTNVTVWDKKTPVAKLVVSGSKWLGMNFHTIESAAVKTEYQGQGIGKELYFGLIQFMGVTLVSSGSHSKGARKLWLRLSNDLNISTYGIDTCNFVTFALKGNLANTELQSIYKKKLYSSSDTAIAMTKKDSEYDKVLQSLLWSKSFKSKDLFGIKYREYSSFY